MVYQLRDEDIVWDALSPRNVVIADLQKGCYTTLTGEGASVLWTLLVERVLTVDILSVLKTLFSTVPDNLSEVVHEIVSSFVTADILVPAAAPNSDWHSLISSFSPSTSFEVTLTRYGDMEALLLLDPIDDALEE